MKSDAPVSEIMTKEVIKLSTKDDLTKAEILFKKYKIRHIPIVSGDKIKGMLSFTDLLRISFADAIVDDSETIDIDDSFRTDSGAYDMLTINQVMTKNPYTISPETTIKETAQIFTNKEFHAIPVCDGESLVGIVTTTDLINYLIQQD